MNLSKFEPLKFKVNHHLLKKPYEWSEFPCVLQIDISNFCGQKYCGIGPCSYCYPQWMIAKGKWKYAEMPMDQIHWLMEQMALYGKNMWYYTLFLNGDGLTDPRLPDILKMGKSVAPNLKNQTFTCGAKTENAWMLCDRNLDWVCVTCSAPNREIYRKVHLGDKFDNVIKTMRYITDNRKQGQKLEVHYVITEQNFSYMQNWYDFMGKEFPDWERIFSPLVRSYDNVPSNNAMGKLTLKMQEDEIMRLAPQAKFWNTQTTGLRQPCVLWNNGAVASMINKEGKYEARLLTCCNWYDSDAFNFGTVEDYMREGWTLKDYWHERLANQQRNPNCRNCNLRHPMYMQRLKNIEFKTTVSS